MIVSCLDNKTSNWFWQVKRNVYPSQNHNRIHMILCKCCSVVFFKALGFKGIKWSRVVYQEQNQVPKILP